MKKKQKKLKQTKKYYEELKNYQHKVQNLKTEQATILAPQHQAIRLEMLRHLPTTILLFITLFAISLAITWPYYTNDTFITLWIRIPIAFILTIATSLIVLNVITLGQKQLYQEQEDEKIAEIKKLYEKLNQRYDRMKQEQMLNVDFSMSETSNNVQKEGEIHAS